MKVQNCRAVTNKLNAKRENPQTKMRVYYSLAVWRFKPTLSASACDFIYNLSGGLRFKIIVRLRKIINLARGFRF